MPVREVERKPGGDGGPEGDEWCHPRREVRGVKGGPPGAFGMEGISVEW